MFDAVPASLISTLDVFVSWFVKIALFLGITFLFPGLLYIVTDTLFYIWRTIAQSMGWYSSSPQSSPKLPRVRAQEWSSSSSGGSGDSEDSEYSESSDEDSDYNSDEDGIMLRKRSKGDFKADLREEGEGIRLRKTNNTPATTTKMDIVETTTGTEVSS